MAQVKKLSHVVFKIGVNGMQCYCYEVLRSMEGAMTNIPRKKFGNWDMYGYVMLCLEMLLHNCAT